MNPCSCGYHGAEDGVRECRCAPGQLIRYRGRVSGPVLDRIDLHIHVSGVPPTALLGPPIPDERIRARTARVASARDAQRIRYRDLDGVECNADLAGGNVMRRIPMDGGSKGVLTAAANALGLSSRACHRILRVARTIADLEGEPRVSEPAVMEAIQYRKPSF